MSLSQQNFAGLWLVRLVLLCQSRLFLRVPSYDYPETNAICTSLEEELSDIDPDFQFHYSQWQTTDRAFLATATSTCEEYKDTLISAINAVCNKTFIFCQMSN